MGDGTKWGRSPGRRIGEGAEAFSFAKQRFDSAVCPARKLCCMLPAVVVALATFAEDDRNAAEKRAMANHHLDNFTPEKITATGMFADYSA